MIDRLHVKVTMRDRDGNFGAITVCLPFASTIAQAMAYGYSLADIALTLSNAVVHEVKATYTSHIETMTADPAISRAQERATIFYRNEGYTFNTISIPCARDDIWLTTGVYRDEQINPLLSNYDDIVALVTDIATECIYSDGTPLPNIFITIARVE